LGQKISRQQTAGKIRGRHGLEGREFAPICQIASECRWEVLGEKGVGPKVEDFSFEVRGYGFLLVGGGIAL
jgi:hypothetical protein